MKKLENFQLKLPRVHALLSRELCFKTSGINLTTKKKKIPTNRPSTKILGDRTQTFFYFGLIIITKHM